MFPKWLIPRFSLRLLLVVVTIAAVGLGVVRPLFVERPITEKEAECVTIGMTPTEVRWRLGAPHHVSIGTNLRTNWGFDYAGSEELPLAYFYVVFEFGHVIRVEQQQYLTY